MIKMKQINSLNRETSFDKDLKNIEAHLNLGVEESVKGIEYAEFNFTKNIDNLSKLSHEHKSKGLDTISLDSLSQWNSKYQGNVLNNLSQLENNIEYCDEDYIKDQAILLKDFKEKRLNITSSNGLNFKISVSGDGIISTVANNN